MPAGQPAPLNASGTIYSYKNVINRFPSTLDTFEGDGDMELLHLTLDFTLFPNYSKVNDNDKIVIEFNHGQINDSLDPFCVFWDPENFKWSQDGCELKSVGENRDFTVCECDHLTSFGLLFGGSPEDEPDWMDNISKVVAGVSIACLLITNIVLHMSK